VPSRPAFMSDDDLLERLSTAFPIAPAEPGLAALDQLAAAVAALHQPVTPAPTPARAPVRRRPRLALPRRLSPLVLTGSVVGALLTGTGISYAVGVPAVRSIAHSVGLAPAPAPPPPTTAPPPPVSPAESAARQAESTLQQALTDHESSAARISHDAADLARRLAAVGSNRGPGSDRTDDDGHHLIAQACQQLAGLPPSGSGSSGGSDGTGPQGWFCDAGGAPSGTSSGRGASGLSGSPGTTGTAPTHDDGGQSGAPDGHGDGNTNGDHDGGTDGHGTATVPPATTPDGSSGSSGSSSGSTPGSSSGSSGGPSGGTSGDRGPTSGQSGGSGSSDQPSGSDGGSGSGSVTTTTVDTSGGDGGHDTH
jgi:hypothetical protein